MSAAVYLDALCEALGVDGLTPAAALTMVHALRQHAHNQREAIEQLLEAAEPEGAAAAIERAEQLLCETIPGAPIPNRRLAVLTHQLRDIHGLLLQSIQVTHADVLHFGTLTRTNEHGADVVSGDFRHTPTGNHYVISIVQIAPAGVQP